MGKIVPFRRVDQSRPFTNAGSCFDDLWGLPAEQSRMLIDRGLVYLTEFVCGDYGYGGLIIAGSWEQAEELARERRLGEKVVGRLDELEIA